MSSEGKLIKPPIDEVKSGKVFKPSKAFRNKNWVLMISIAVGIWVTFISIMLGIGYLVFGLIGQSGFQSWVDVFWNLINPWYWLLTAIWFIPAFILYPIYINAFEYSVIAESGETMPEIYVKKGLINITRKHVPLRTITNISTRAGPFDRIFGIGTVEVETAGASGPQVGGSAEERLEGLVFYEELRDFILRELRRFKAPYVTGTEVVIPEDETVISGGSSIEEEVLKVLEDIRDLLRDRS